MCGRYAFFTIKGLQELFNIPDTELNSVTPSYNIAPYTDICAIANGHVKLMYWQLVPDFSKGFKSQFSMFNTRVESFSESRYKEELLKESRCLIPADNYYEWKKVDKHKIPYLFRRPDQSLIFFAGINTVWKDTATKSLKLSCSIITRDANKTISDIHNRMPVMIKNEFLKDWLSSETKLPEIKKIMDESANYELEFYRISEKVNKTENNSPELLTPA